MIFERKIYHKLKEWKELSHGQTALLLEGARRIGKSTIVETFAQNEYDDYLILDFAQESKEIKKNFEDNIGDLDTFFRNLFLLKGKTLSNGNCVIIFDEVQLFPTARQAIKYLVKDGRYDYLETGSLISIKKNVQHILIPSEEYRLKMYPMDFEEFLWAKKDNITMSVIRDAFTRKKPLGDPIHQKIMQIFRTYMAVGGMPQAVQAFVDGKSYQEIDFIKRSILSLYDNDLRKYDNDSHEKASVIFKTFGKPGINQGMILENMAAQMLKANGYDLFFHEFMYHDKEAAKEKKYEIDFLFVKKKKICPIEVKSSSYKNHKSFDLFLQKYQLKTEDKFILYTKDFKYEDGIMYLPLYMTICL